MENKQCVRLWENNAEYKPLRRPNTNSKIENKKTSSEETIVSSTIDSTESPPPVTETKDFSDILNTSQLRVEAEEWFPSSYTTPTPIQSAQSRLQKIRIGNNMSENCDSDTSQSFDPANLDTLIKSLIYDPGQFGNLIDNFMAILEPHFDDLNVMIKTAETIFDYALREPSFRYNAARLCGILNEQCPLFRPRLHILCNKQLDSDKGRQGLTLFLAEIYMQHLQYQAVYGGCLIQSLQKLISTRASEDIKSACQALKLTGYSLDSNNKETLDELFQELQLSVPFLSHSVVELMESVFTLRENNWGRNTNVTLYGNSSQEQNGVISCSSDEDTFYGPDGQEITPEEHQFLYENMNIDYLGGESSDPDELYNPEPEMDKEIREAFREFVKLSKR